jgi:hypothetical protein
MTLRARVLLYKQDELRTLEEALEQIDKTEQREIFLGSRRLDTNKERAQVMSEIEQKLSSYGMLVAVACRSNPKHLQER